MKIWVVSSCYQNEMLASTHLTKKGAFIRAITELWEAMGFDYYDNIDEFWGQYGYPNIESEHSPRGGGWVHDRADLGKMTSEDLKTQFWDMSELYFEHNQDSYERVELEVIETEVNP